MKALSWVQSVFKHSQRKFRPASVGWYFLSVFFTLAFSVLILLQFPSSIVALTTENPLQTPIAVATSNTETVLFFQTDEYAVRVYRPGEPAYMNLYDRKRGKLRFQGKPATFGAPKSVNDPWKTYVSRQGDVEYYARINETENITELEIVQGGKSLYRMNGKLVTVAPASAKTPVAVATTEIVASTVEVPETENQSKLPRVAAAKTYLQLSGILTIFFITLGPLKAIGPFIQLTNNATPQFSKQLALRAAMISSVVSLVVAIVGQSILSAWNISISALLIASGLILLLVALKMVMQQYAPPAPPASPPESQLTLGLAVTPLAFPTLITPHGLALLIVLMAATQDMERQLWIIGLLAIIMFLNWLCLTYARQIVKALGMVTLQIIGLVLSVIQVALAIELMIQGFLALGVVG